MAVWLRRLGLVMAGLLVAAMVLLAGWYQIDGQPLPETQSYLESADYQVKELPDGGWEFIPSQANGIGLGIYHGALIKTEAYFATAAFYAAQGYRVLIPAGPMRLSLLAADAFADLLDAQPEAQWVLLGHSMGGMTALGVAEATSKDVAAVAIWAGSIIDDRSGFEAPLLYVYGDTDGLLPPERVESARGFLPPTTRFELVSGANHRNFAQYSHQFFDSDATLPMAEQRETAERMTSEFFAGHLTVTSSPASTPPGP